MRRLLTTIALGVLAVAGCGDEDPNRTPGPADIAGVDLTPDAEVEVDEDGFRPAEVTIEQHGVLVVRNTGDQPHEIADLDDIDSGRLQPGDEITIVLDDPGTFTYHDALEPEHEGTVVVEPLRR